MEADGHIVRAASLSYRDEHVFPMKAAAALDAPATLVNETEPGVIAVMACD
jgi:hypothetical protein